MQVLPVRLDGRVIPIITVLLLGGCASHHCAAVPATAPTTRISAPSANRDVDAYVDPPLGWRMDPLKVGSRHTHEVWVSPTGRTAYGIIHFSLPLPVGYDLVLWGFLREMERSEGDARMIDKRWDQDLAALRFVADGGRYRVRVNLFVDGWQGWAVYAGSLRNQPLMPDELALAELAREHTVVGLSAENSK